MIYVDVGFSEPTKVYHIKPGSNVLMGQGYKTLPDLVEYLDKIPSAHRETILLDAGYPRIIKELKKYGFWVQGVR